MLHGNARLTVRVRLEMVKQVLSGWPQAEVARQFRVSRATVSKWLRRYRAQGEHGLGDRSSRPAHSPTLTPHRIVRAICALRRFRSWGPHRIGWHLGIARSTVYAVLRRAGLSRLAWLHRTTREIVRYEHPRPGDMLHLDVKKLGRVPEGGGKRFAPGFAENPCWAALEAASGHGLHARRHRRPLTSGLRRGSERREGSDHSWLP